MHLCVVRFKFLLNSSHIFVHYILHSTCCMLHATFYSYWLAVKKSVTEDALKFVVESRDVDVAEAMKAELFTFLESMSR